MSDGKLGCQKIYSDMLDYMRALQRERETPEMFPKVINTSMNTTSKSFNSLGQNQSLTNLRNSHSRNLVTQDSLMNIKSMSSMN